MLEVDPMVKLVEKIRMELNKHEIELLDIYRYNPSKGSGRTYVTFRVAYGGNVFLVKFDKVKEAMSLDEIVKRIVKEVGAK